MGRKVNPQTASLSHVRWLVNPSAIQSTTSLFRYSAARVCMREKAYPAWPISMSKRAMIPHTDRIRVLGPLHRPPCLGHDISPPSCVQSLTPSMEGAERGSLLWLFSSPKFLRTRILCCDSRLSRVWHAAPSADGLRGVKLPEVLAGKENKLGVGDGELGVMLPALIVFTNLSMPGINAMQDSFVPGRHEECVSWR